MSYKKRMLIVDSHCHVSTCWYEPVECLLSQMDRNGVAQAVLVQIIGRADNSYQQECVRRFPGRFTSVVVVDTASDTACSDLRRLAEEGASGVRLHPTTRSLGSDPLAIWRTAMELGLGVSCAGTALEFAKEEFAHVVGSLPGLTIVLEHLGSGPRPDANDSERAARLKTFDLARFPNVYIKVPGLGEFCNRAQPVRDPFPFEEPLPPLLELAYEAFGALRMMWGSNFPPVSHMEGYRNALQFTMDQFASKSQEELELIFGRVALSVFPVRS
jgi:L-fuconolactonase